jgi:hypothetical protein
MAEREIRRSKSTLEVAQAEHLAAPWVGQRRADLRRRWELHRMMRDFDPGGDAVTMWICQLSVASGREALHDARFCAGSDAVTIGKRIGSRAISGRSVTL